jgi:3-oxoacyl-[acyl-carrier protein] reductase
VDRDDASLQHITKDASVAQCDVSNEDQVRDVFAQYSYQNPSILINCAGITRDGWISNLSANDDWDSVLDSNLKGTFLMCREFIRLQNARLKQGEARQACSIINIGSVVSEYGNLGQTNYAASKGGVLGLTRALAKETARGDVRVNAVLPGFIDTPMAQQVPMHVQEQIMNKIPMGRFGQPEEVADLILFLASPRSSYITGECIKVSGMISL